MNQGKITSLILLDLSRTTRFFCGWTNALELTVDTSSPAECLSAIRTRLRAHLFLLHALLSQTEQAWTLIHEFSTMTYLSYLGHDSYHEPHSEATID